MPWHGGAFGTAAQGRARHPRAPTEVCEAGASSVVLVPRIRAGPEPLAEGCSISVCRVSSSRLAGASAATLRDPACRQAPPSSRSSREVKATPNTPPARTEPRGPPAPPVPDPLSPTRGCQYSDHSTALLPLSTVTTWEPAGDQATALMDELQRERWGHG